MMRLEKLTAQALEQTGNDRYVLAVAVSQRVEQLSKGAKPLVEADLKKVKLTDLALMEIASGLLAIEVSE